MRSFFEIRIVGTLSLVIAMVGVGCSSERMKNHAKEAAARYWQDKAYPGKSFDVQVIDAEKAEGGSYRVKGIVDGESRVGIFYPESETFSEGYYSLSHEREKRIAELEQEVKYWKEKSEGMDKEIFKLKVRLGEPTEKQTEKSPVKPQVKPQVKEDEKN